MKTLLSLVEKSIPYLPPQITVLQICLEEGFATSNDSSYLDGGSGFGTKGNTSAW